MVDLAREVGADVIVKGLRVASDFEFELRQAQMNEPISGMQTVFVPCASSQSLIASSLLRDIAHLGSAERVTSVVPNAVTRALLDVSPLLHTSQPICGHAPVSKFG
jgi:pantetheine-phosphate adenylyltransferase